MSDWSPTSNVVCGLTAVRLVMVRRVRGTGRLSILCTVLAATATLRISGVFHTGDVDGFVSTIVAYLPVRTRESQDGTTRLIGR